VPAPALTQPDLLSIWERGEGARTTRRALALLGGAAPDATAERAAAMPIGRRDAALLDLRVALFGNAFAGITTCPACGEDLELTFDASEVRRRAAEQELLELHIDDDVIDVRLPGTADLAAIEHETSVANGRERLLARCIDRDPASLPQHVVDAIVQAMADADPQADVSLELTCPACEQVWREPFDIVTFLWTELASWARHLLADVHDLASAYGWSESEILCLSPTRRDVYLEMLR
jgi:hypothetical protein